MDKLSFPIYEPAEKKFKITPNLIVFGLWLITITFFWLFDSSFSPNSNFKSYCLTIVFVVTMYFLITSIFSYEPLNGVMNGEIIFEEDKIEINEKVFELKNINKLDFGFGDFYGDRSLASYNFNPSLSQGVGNSVSFTDNTGQTHKIYFKLMSRNQYKNLYPFINSAVKIGAMTYYRAIDLIDVENVTKPGN